MENDLQAKRENPHWSFSALNSYLNICQMQFYFRYIEKAEVERRSAALPFGRAFHATLFHQAEAAMNGGKLTLEDAACCFGDYWLTEVRAIEELVIFKPGEDIDTLRAKGVDMLAAYLPNWSDFYSIRSVSETFDVFLPGLREPLIGEFDMVVDEGHDPCIVDWKTSCQRWPAGKADKDLQATIYCYAYHHINKQFPLFRFDIVTKAKTPVLDVCYTQRGADSFKRLEFLACRVQDAVDKGVFIPAETSFACGECPYTGRCGNYHEFGGQNA